jgi:hypothetical protein
MPSEVPITLDAGTLVGRAPVAKVTIETEDEAEDGLFNQAVGTRSSERKLK